VHLKYKYWFFKKAVPIPICQKILSAGRSKIQQVGITLHESS